MIEIRERLNDGVNIMDSEGDVRPLDDFIDSDGAIIDLPDPLTENAAIATADALADADAAFTVAKERYERASEEYDDRLESLANNIGSYLLAREALAKRGIYPPVEPEHPQLALPEAQTTADFVQQLREDGLQQKLSATDTILDPADREKARTEILAQHRAKEEHRQRPAGEVRRRNGPRY